MHTNKIVYIFYFLIAISIVVLVFIGTAFQVDRSSMKHERVIEFNSGWVLKTSDGTQSEISLPANVHSGVEKNKTNQIQNVLPIDLKDGMTLYFSAYHATVQVFVDDLLVYEFGIDNQYKFGKSPACAAWNFVDLPQGSQGKNVTILLCSPYDKYAGSFNSIGMGTKSAILEHMIQKFLPSIIISVLIMFFGMGLLTVFFISKVKARENSKLFYEGTFMVLISIAAFTELPVVLVISNNVFLWGYIMYFSLMLCPIPYLLFIKESYVKNGARKYDILCIAAAAGFVIITFLQVANILDFAETVIITHIIYTACLILSVSTAYEELVKKRNKDILPFAFGSVMLIAFFSVDLVRYYLGTYEDGSLPSRVGLLVFTVIPAVNTLFHHHYLMELGMEARVYKKLAFTDRLTQKGNRAAFESEINENCSEEERLRTVIVTFDVNDLKLVNDSFGHSYGDKAIMEAAESIDLSFRKFGKCFRIGGDEFAVLAKNCDMIGLKECLNNFAQKQNQDDLKIAFGYAKYKPVDKDLKETFNRADRRMYRQKRKMKLYGQAKSQ